MHICTINNAKEVLDLLPEALDYIPFSYEPASDAFPAMLLLSGGAFAPTVIVEGVSGEPWTAGLERRTLLLALDLLSDPVKIMQRSGDDVVMLTGRKGGEWHDVTIPALPRNIFDRVIKTKQYVRPPIAGMLSKSAEDNDGKPRYHTRLGIMYISTRKRLYTVAVADAIDELHRSHEFIKEGT